MGNYSIDETKVRDSITTIIDYCAERKRKNASCLGCPARKNYGTKQPEVCKFNMITRPSDLEK